MQKVISTSVGKYEYDLEDAVNEFVDEYFIDGLPDKDPNYPYWYDLVDDIKEELRNRFSYETGLVMSDALHDWMTEYVDPDYLEGLPSYGRRVKRNIVEWMVGLEMAQKQLESKMEETKSRISILAYELYKQEKLRYVSPEKIRKALVEWYGSDSKEDPETFISNKGYFYPNYTDFLKSVYPEKVKMKHILRETLYKDYLEDIAE
jgi:hypothetical protein